MAKCPRCESQQIRHRKANLPENVKRREKGEHHDRWVCDECEWSGDDEAVILNELPVGFEYIDPMEV